MIFVKYFNFYVTGILDPWAIKSQSIDDEISIVQHNILSGDKCNEIGDQSSPTFCLHPNFESMTPNFRKPPESFVFDVIKEVSVEIRKLLYNVIGMKRKGLTL
ncbi:hypothetical protein AVEN_211976-1 [Araneus ventricosus]|uniref:Uncharacterized protein n=1 Tax=Araneus ventricosus TaxID=182803 RepID=A0A4Y2FZH3_ARAVE|nr:hypothetical protein AVEN_211976-1 [Araneus ventricosus]